MVALLALFSINTFAAQPEERHLVDPVDWSLDADAVDALLEDSIGGHVGIRWMATGPDGRVRPLAEYLPEVEPPPAKPGELWSMPVDYPGVFDGGLRGHAVYLSQCHGWKWYDSLSDFSLQRSLAFQTFEDYHNPEGLNQYLTAYLENAGAAVFTVRERDLQTMSAISDNDGAGYSEYGGDFSSENTGFLDQSPWAYGENPFESGSGRRFSATGGARAVWIPDVPADGYYAVYLSWVTGRDSVPNAHYRIHHKGGVIERYFDQRVHGSTWRYAETLWLERGVNSLEIELIADGATEGTLSADAVRVGGGVGDVQRYGVGTGRPRWEEGAILSTQFNGAPKSVYDPSSRGDGNDVSSRSRWAAWEHPENEPAVYLSWHSNAGGGQGTSTYTYAPDFQLPDAGTEGSFEFGDLVQEELIEAIHAQWDSSWTDRGHLTHYFGEVNPNHNPEMPSALVELGFHDNSDDVWHLLNPAFRRDAARAMYRATVRYFASVENTVPRFLPEPPESLALIQSADKGLTLSWKPGPYGAPLGDAPQRYRVFSSADGRSWDSGVVVDGLRYSLPSQAGRTLFVRVAAVNEGGMSFPSEVLGASVSPDFKSPVLLVDSVDRLDGGLLESVSTPLGQVERLDVRRLNGFDNVAVIGRSLSRLGWPFDSVSDERLSEIDLSQYSLLMLNVGEDSTVDETLSDGQQAQVRAFVEAGGALWISGAEILWDLDYKGSASDKAFAQDVLGATMESDAASTHVVSGEGPLQGLDLRFGASMGGAYPVEYPDVLTTDRSVIARYETGGVAATYDAGVVFWGFPFETIADSLSRDRALAELLPLLVPDYEVPEIIEPPVTEVPSGDTSAMWERQRLDSFGCGCGSTRLSLGGLGWLLVLVGLRRRGYGTVG